MLVKIGWNEGEAKCDLYEHVYGVYEYEKGNSQQNSVTCYVRELI